jgi:hypothetical protein
LSQKREVNVMKKLFILISMVAVLASFVPVAMALPVLDQDSPYGNWLSNSELAWQQGVTVGIAGILDHIEFLTVHEGTVDIYINRGAPWQSDTSYDFEGTLISNDSNPGWASLDTSAAGLQFEAGEFFVIGIKPQTSSVGGLGGSYDAYDGGELWLKGSSGTPEPYDGFDIAFRTYMEQPAVPEPGTMLLLGVGLIGLVGLRRKKFKK